MRDLLDELTATRRDVRRRVDDGAELVVVAVQRRYEAPVEDVWDALTDPERVARWAAPLSGDLREGGSFRLEGNTEGEIRRCDPPRSLTVTWGAPVSLVRVQLSAEGEATLLELAHSVPVELTGSGAGGLYVGPGWDVTVLALALFLRGEVVEDPVAWEGTLEVQRFSERSIAAWAGVVTAGRTASDDEVAAAVDAARAQFAPDLPTAPATADD
jgi:uncharacterized protein YndB with AHSA1/START domain